MFTQFSVLLNQLTRSIRFFLVNQNALRDQCSSTLTQMIHMIRFFSVNQSVSARLVWFDPRSLLFRDRKILQLLRSGSTFVNFFL